MTDGMPRKTRPELVKVMRIVAAALNRRAAVTSRGVLWRSRYRRIISTSSIPPPRR